MNSAWTSYLLDSTQDAVIREKISSETQTEWLSQQEMQTHDPWVRFVPQWNDILRQGLTQAKVITEAKKLSKNIKRVLTGSGLLWYITRSTYIVKASGTTR